MKHPDEMRLLKTKLSYPVLTSGIWQYIVVTLTILVSSWICFHFTEYIGYQSVSFILLFVVSILSIFMGIGPITLASSLSAFIWNFFFIPPFHTFHIEKTEDILKNGQVITIEPGIYKDFGIRIEDDVLVTAKGCRVLTKFPKKLIIIPKV